MKSFVLLAFAAVLYGCAAVQQVASPPLGTWFENKSGKELFVLENDGSGAWKGTAYRKFDWTYDQKAKVVTISETDRSAKISRFSYSESDRLLRSIDDAKLVAVSERSTDRNFPASK